MELDVLWNSTTGELWGKLMAHTVLDTVNKHMKPLHLQGGAFQIEAWPCSHHRPSDHCLKPGSDCRFQKPEMLPGSERVGHLLSSRGCIGGA